MNIRPKGENTEAIENYIKTKINIGNDQIEEEI